LKKYGTDLVEQARKNKSDPVHRRDDKIRNVIRILSRKQKQSGFNRDPGVGKPLSPKGSPSGCPRRRTPHSKRKDHFFIDMGGADRRAKSPGRV
jgi:ATP-dependent Clp protease ATP-binding subunit ClpB